jgi:RNA polymerase sigma factor (sigma-70 family)
VSTPTGTGAEIVDHLFRREAGRLVSALVRALGPAQLALAEDVVQEALLRAVHTWKVGGPPADPRAWILAVARRCAIDRLRRDSAARAAAPEWTLRLETEWALAPAVDTLFEEPQIRDGELRTLLTCCDPRLPEAAQVALVLNVLCGFSAREIAAAFLEQEPAVKKRLGRARALLASAGELWPARTAADVQERLEPARRAVYLLFNEGFHGASVRETVRVELCEDALRLAEILAGDPVAGTPPTRALFALLCLHGARLPARMQAGELVPLGDQDRTLWDGALAARGIRALDEAAEGEPTRWHVEAAIAAEHACAPSLEGTAWDRVVHLYDALLAIEPGPVPELARAIAVGFRDGPEAGLRALDAMPARRLAEYPFFHAARGELHLRAGRPLEARRHLARARELARSEAERRHLDRRIAACG